jgi:hypothetical protein
MNLGLHELGLGRSRCGRPTAERSRATGDFDKEKFRKSTEAPNAPRNVGTAP